MIKTKIIVTYGPSISKAGTLKRILKYADIVRINFSQSLRKRNRRWSSNSSMTS